MLFQQKSPFQHFQVFLQKNLLSWLRCCARRCTSWPFLLSGRQRRIDYVIIRAKQTRTHKDLLHFLTFDQIKVFLKMSCLDFFDARESKWVKRPCQRALCFCQKTLKSRVSYIIVWSIHTNINWSKYQNRRTRFAFDHDQSAGQVMVT